jgi:hypothetical protein
MNIRFRDKKNIDIKNTKKQRLGAVLRREQTSSVLFSRGKRSEVFFTEDSQLYITPREREFIRKGLKLNRDLKRWDSLSSRIVRDFVYHKPEEANRLIELLEKRYAIFNDSFADASRNFIGQFSMVKLWNFSIVGSILFGMLMMTFVYRYLGQGASAQQSYTDVAQTETAQKGQVLGAEVSADDAEAFTKQVLELEQAKDQKALEKKIDEMVKGYPIEKMVPYIAKKDRTVAAFLISIAKKESAWGVHAPVLDGQDCYNYWGYRGIRKLMGTGGHTCFNSPKDAVDTVSKRIETLIEEYGKNTPAKMVIWKCGQDCEATGGQASANKWISDVTMYFNKLNEEW